MTDGDEVAWVGTPGLRRAAANPEKRPGLV
jgi:hypothetical protein